jgi:hypothetical protein
VFDLTQDFKMKATLKNVRRREITSVDVSLNL